MECWYFNYVDGSRNNTNDWSDPLCWLHISCTIEGGIAIINSTLCVYVCVRARACVFVCVTMGSSTVCYRLCAPLQDSPQEGHGILVFIVKENIAVLMETFQSLTVVLNAKNLNCNPWNPNVWNYRRRLLFTSVISAPISGLYMCVITNSIHCDTYRHVFTELF